MRMIKFIDEFFYSNFENNWDDKLFRKILIKYINDRSKILDLGAGAGLVEEMNFKGIAKSVYGIDLDERVLANNTLDEGRLADASNIPFCDNLFDIVFADNLMEHLEKPEEVFKEIHRVLKPGGFLFFKTPNRWHYVSIISRFTPLRLHKFYNKIRGRDFDDTFKTFYSANSIFQIKKLSQNSGFTIENVDYIEGRPEYLRISPFTYVFGMIYERVVNSSNIFSLLRVVIIARLQKT